MVKDIIYYPVTLQSNCQHTTYTKRINNFPKLSVMQSTDEYY